MGAEIVFGSASAAVPAGRVLCATMVAIGEAGGLVARSGASAEGGE